MSIATSLQKVLDSKEAIKTSINNKGGQITSATPFSAYSAAIDNLPSGGGGDGILKSISESEWTGTAFTDCKTYITAATIPSSVTYYGQSAFDGFINLKRLNSNTDGVFNLPSGMTTLPNTVFQNCKSLEKINIPSGLTRIGNSCFQNCSGLTSITEDLSNITSIGAYAFSGCTSLSGAINLNGVTSLSQCVFEGAKISAITVDNVQYTSYHVFYDSLIETLNLPSIKSCGDNVYFGAFQYMFELTGITFGSSLTSITGPYTFRGCPKLLSVTFESTTPPSVPTLFENQSANLVIYVPAESVEAYKATTGFVNYADRIQAIPSA